MATYQRVDIAVFQARDTRGRINDGAHHEIDTRRLPPQRLDQSRHHDEVAIVGRRNRQAMAGCCRIEG